MKMSLKDYTTVQERDTVKATKFEEIVIKEDWFKDNTEITI